MTGVKTPVIRVILVTGYLRGKRLFPGGQLHHGAMPAIDLVIFVQRQLRLFGHWQERRNAKVGDRKCVSDQIFASLQMLVQDAGELMEKASGLFDRVFIGIPEAECRLSLTLKQQCASMA